jgi:hypothetical protein
MLERRRESALRWLAGAAGRETSWVQRLRFLLAEGHVQHIDGTGFPWFPDTAAWVTPTCFGLLALQKASRRSSSPDILARCASAREYLLTHACRDAGWNHGSTSALGYDSDSYPETTGQSLLALNNVPNEKLHRAIGRAQAHLQQCRSNEAMSWLKLGLLAQKQTLPECALPTSHGSVIEISLNILAEAASQGHHVFLD